MCRLAKVGKGAAVLHVRGMPCGQVLRWQGRLVVRRSAFLLCVLVVLSGCADVEPTHEDQRRYVELVQRFGQTYEFKMEDVYLRATRKSGEPTPGEATDIVRAFWFESSGRPRSDSRLTYLNMYGADGFRFQAYYDRRSEQIAFGQSEHY